MMTLEDEISHLQKENSRIESQLSRWLWCWSLVSVLPYKMVLVASKTLVKYEHLRMKGDVSSTEGDVVADDRVRKITITRFRFVSFVYLSSLPPFLLCFFVLLNGWIMITYSAIYHSPVSILVLHSLICILIIPQLNFCKIFQDQNELKRKNAKLTDYYENLRSNVFSIFGTQNYADSYLGLHLMSNYGGWHETWICQLYEMTSPGSKAPIRGPEESGAPHEKVKQKKYSSVEL